MKLIESKVEYLPQEEGLEGVYKQIEKCGRVSYKSEDKITEDSAEPFVKRMIDSHHGAVLEQGTVYLKVPVEIWREDEHEWIYMFPEELPWVSLDCDGKYWYITTNFRHILESNMGIKTMNEYLCSPTEFHEKRYTFKFTCSRAIANELIRHRTFSFMQESQRFVNYSKEKFGNEISYLMPSWYPESSVQQQEAFMQIMKATEDCYMALLGQWDEKKPDRRFKTGFKNNPLTPQQARDVLPNATKTELIMTGFSSDWRYLLDLRLFEKTGAVHPDMLDLMKKLQKVAEETGIWDDIMKYKSKFD